MPYYIELENISLHDYRKKLETAYLPPSRMVLKEMLNERFAVFSENGILSVATLLETLKKKEKLFLLSSKNPLNERYLKILLRELKSMLPKPNSLNEFKVISADVICKLEALGLKNTLKLYNRVLTPEKRKSLASMAVISSTELDKLASLCDFSRIKWVGTTYAQLLLGLGFKTVKELSKADPDQLHGLINNYIKQNQIFKGSIGLNDVNILVEISGELDHELIF